MTLAPLYHLLRRLISPTPWLMVVALLTLAPISEATAASPRRNADRVKREKEATQRAISETTQKIKANTRETEKQLQRLGALESQISGNEDALLLRQSTIEELDNRLQLLTDSIARSQHTLEQLRKSYGRALRSMQASNTSMSPMAFLFSSSSVAQAWQRLRYLRQFNVWRKQRTAQISEAMATLNTQRTSLHSLQQRHRVEADSIEAVKSRLESQRAETDHIVADLRKQGSTLRALLKEKEEQARRLDKELDRIIAEEQRRIEQQRREEEARRAEAEKKRKKESTSSSTPTTGNKPQSGSSEGSGTILSSVDNERALTGSFSSNKGRLPMPIEGKYRIERGFGRQKHPLLPHVETENSGVDLEAISTNKARAVFNGRVSAVFQQPGYNTIVMIRHGEYLTVYANLSNIYVKIGDEVSAMQPIGTIYRNPDSGNRCILHFELRHERDKLNPMLWVK